MRDGPFIDKNDVTREGVRESLKLPHFDVIQHMDSLGWDVNVAFPGKHSGHVSFVKRDPWHQRPKLATHCTFGYSFSNVTQDSLDDVTQRAAEFCLRVYETLGNLLPSNPNSYGVVSPCPIANQSRYRDTTYNDFVSRHNHGDFKIRSQCFLHSDSWQFTYYKTLYSVPYALTSTLLPQVRFSLGVAAGDTVFVG